MMIPSSSTTVTELADSLAAAFASWFGVSPNWRVAAPGRVNLIGEHTDYNQGPVLPMAIDRYTVAVAGPGAGEQIEVFSRQADSAVRLSTEGPFRTRGTWQDYIAGIAAGFSDLGIRLSPLRVMIDSTLPLGSGLSSSASLGVVLAGVFNRATGAGLTPLELVRLCQRAEHRFAGVPCGIMDMFISVHGRSGTCLLLDCQTLEWERVPVDSARWAFIVIDTGVRHALADGEYARRRETCQAVCRKLGLDSLRELNAADLRQVTDSLTETEYRRARHVVDEIERTWSSAEALRTGDGEALGRLMYASHQSLVDDYEVSCPELDQLVATAMELGPSRGVLGARMTGGGFGGSVIVLVERDAAKSLEKAFQDPFFARFGREPKLFEAIPSDGVHGC